MTGPPQVTSNILSKFHIVDRELCRKLARLRQLVDVHLAITAINAFLLIFYITLHWGFKLFSVTQEPKSSLIVQVSRSNTDQPGGNLLNDWSALRRATCTTHNRHKIPTSMPSAAFETTVQAFKRLQICALDLTVSGIGQASTGFLIMLQNNCDYQTI
jgi:hypothetical protein